jgi:hypothetical protein
MLCVSVEYFNIFGESCQQAGKDFSSCSRPDFTQSSTNPAFTAMEKSFSDRSGAAPGRPIPPPAWRLGKVFPPGGR